MKKAIGNLTDLQLAVVLKYGFEHIKSTITADTFLSLRRAGVEGSFRTLDEALEPAVVVSDRLLDELKGDADELSSELQAAMATHRLVRGLDEIKPDNDSVISGLTEPAPALREQPVVRQDFFKVVLKGPSKIRGQTSDTRVTWKPGELVVSKQSYFFRGTTDVFLYTDSAEAEKDLMLMAPADNLLPRLVHWTADPEKYYWNASLEPYEDLRRGAMQATRTLMNAGAIQGRAPPYNVSNTDEDLIISMKELERLRIVVNSSSGGDVSGWSITEHAANTLEPITRLYRPRPIIQHFLTDSVAHMSVLSLVSALEGDGWEHKQWSTARGSKPPPVVIARGRPKVFYSKVSADNIVLSKLYLQSLLSCDKISCHPVIDHFEPDAHYRWLLSNGVKSKKRERNDAIENADDELAALLDEPGRAKRARGGLRTSAGKLNSAQTQVNKSTKSLVHICAQSRTVARSFVNVYLVLRFERQVPVVVVAAVVSKDASTRRTIALQSGDQLS